MSRAGDFWIPTFQRKWSCAKLPIFFSYSTVCICPILEWLVMKVEILWRIFWYFSAFQAWFAAFQSTNTWDFFAMKWRQKIRFFIPAPFFVFLSFSLSVHLAYQSRGRLESVFSGGFLCCQHLRTTKWNGKEQAGPLVKRYADSGCLGHKSIEQDQVQYHFRHMFTTLLLHFKLEN